MKTYEIYQMGKLPLLAVVEAEYIEVDYALKRIKFNKGTVQNIAVLVDCKQEKCVVNIDLVKVGE